MASEVYAFLKEKDALSDDKLRVYPNPDYLIPGFNDNLEVKDLKSLTKSIPPLIKGYIRIGSKICGAPALDKVFGTVDVFILFDRSLITEKYGKHYDL
jgi:putative hemolysin